MEGGGYDLYRGGEVSEIAASQAAPKPRPTFAEIQAGFRAREAYVKAKVEELRGAIGVRFKEKPGVKYPVGDIVVSPSASEPGHWQLTWFGRGGGEPHGHAVYPDFDQAVSSAMGQFTKFHGPPHGSSNFEPVDVKRSRAREVVEAEWLVLAVDAK